MNDTFLMGSTRSIAVQILGKNALRQVSFSVTLRDRRAVRLKRCCVAVYGWILIMFFSALIALSNTLDIANFCC